MRQGSQGYFSQSHLLGDWRPFCRPARPR
jgi:hypothetical protein